LRRDQVKADDAIPTPSPAPLLDPHGRREAEERLGGAEASRLRSKAVFERAQAQAVQAKNDLDRARTLTERGAPVEYYVTMTVFAEARHRAS
jgi:hypothetical protein